MLKKLASWSILTAALLSSVASGRAQPPRGGLTINQMRVLGSHNSFRPVLTGAEKRWSIENHRYQVPGLQYAHLPIEQQLDLGLQQIELDAYDDPEGGRFAAAYDSDPSLAKDAAIMRAPGIKVLHVPDDPWSSCLTLQSCLKTIAAWAAQHPRHPLVYILLNTHATPGKRPGDPAVEFGAAALDEADRLERSILGSTNLVTPDDVRKNDATLRDAVLHAAWPRVDATVGKFLFVLDATPATEAFYKAGHASLAGRAMFGWYDEASPEAAFFNIQNPIADEASITQLVRRGFMVRTRADAETREARSHDHRRLSAALASGAQLISTDYYPGAPDPWHFHFEVSLPGGLSDKDPVTASGVATIQPARAAR